MNDTTKQIKPFWDTIIRNQVKFGLPFDLTIYYSSDRWHTSQSVLDIGTGSGLYLLELAKLFPQKDYLGIDLSSDSILQAKSLSKNEPYTQINVTFEDCDLYDVDDTFDYIIARLLVQHINNYEKFLSYIDRKLNPGAELLLIESDDDGRLYHPELPLMREFTKKLQVTQKKYGGNRFALQEIDRLAPSFGFELVQKQSILVPSSISDYKHKLYEVLCAAFEVVRLQYKMEYDYKSLRAEWDDWYKSPKSYTHGSIAFARYRKVDK